jgi:hypothetical protein
MIGVVRAASTSKTIYNYQLISETQFGASAGAQSYSIPAGTIYIDIEMFGGGGGGGAANSFTFNRNTWYSGAGGGAGGGYVRAKYFGDADGKDEVVGAITGNMQAGDTIHFTVGAAGAGAAANGGWGASGGATYLQSHQRSGTTILTFAGLTASGGGGGQGGRVDGGRAIGGATAQSVSSLSIYFIDGSASRSGVVGGLTSTSGSFGGTGSSGAVSGITSSISSYQNGGSGGNFVTNQQPRNGTSTIDQRQFPYLYTGVAGGGGGGGYNEAGTGLTARQGATGGIGAVVIRAYG